MNTICERCALPNHTLHWHETAQGFVCVGCYYDRRAEQTKIQLKYPKTPITDTICAK